MISSLAAVALALPSWAGRPAPALASACGVKYEAGADLHTTVAADGAKMVWKARPLSASDWASNGFASEVMWVGTDGQDPSVTWVEAGATHGWKGSPDLTFYTAHGDYSVNPHIYNDWEWTTPTVVLGTTYTFTGFADATGQYRTTVNAPNGNSHDWPGHNPNTVYWTGGSESTCGAPSVISRTFVSVDQYRRKSDHVYVNAPSGSLFDVDADGGSAWCTSPVTFRYWMNDSNNASCS